MWSGPKGASVQERLDRAQEAKKALLERFKKQPGPGDKEFDERQAQLKAVAEARRERELLRAKEKAEAEARRIEEARLKAERDAREAAEAAERAVREGQFSGDAPARFPQLIVAPLLLAVLWDGLFARIDPLDVGALLAAHRELLTGKARKGITA